MAPHRSSSAPSSPDPADPAAALLRSLAERLAAEARHQAGPPHLVGVVDGPRPPGPDRVEPALVSLPLPADDPVRALLGVVAPPEWWAVGLVAPATTRSLDRPHQHRDCWFVHLVALEGTSVALVVPEGGAPAETASHEPAGGRVADLCRRALALPTPPPPPPPHRAAFVVDIWLGLVVRAAIERPGLDWGQVAALHPGVVASGGIDPAAPPTPASLAACTRRSGDCLDWESLRLACVDADRTPFGELTGTEAAWLDTGSFARWLLAEAPPWTEVLDLLEALVAPSAADRLWATLSIDPPVRWCAPSTPG